MKRNKGKKRATVILGVLVLILAIAMVAPPLMGSSSYDIEPNPIPTDPPKVEEEAIELTIAAVGDVMVHKPQLAAQYDKDTGTYSFANNFEYIKKYITAADLALCNLETTFAGGTYSGYPVFNAPDSLAEALKDAGFDVALTANNHIMDKGLDGMKRTLEITRQAGLKTAGSQLEGEKNYAMVEVKDVKIGIVAYGYETSKVDGRTTINGNYVPEEALPLLNTFNYTTLDEDLKQVGESIQSARADGAELVVCYYHWGEEYQRSPNDYQVYIARQTASFGADIIFASHPHVLQGMEILTDEHSGKEVPVFYSMGNFISNQRAETLNNRYTEQGMIAQVNIEYMKSSKEILSLDMSVVPTWVDKYQEGGKDVYSIIPLDGNLEQNPTLAASGHLHRAQQALEEIKSHLGLPETER